MGYRSSGEDDVIAFFGIAFLIWILGSWLTHVIICIKAGSWGFLIAGAIFFPVAWIHGTGAWFGAW